MPKNPHQTPSQFRPPQRKNTLVYVLVFALLLTGAYYLFNPQGPTGAVKSTEIPISQMVTYYNDQKFSSIEIKSDKIIGTAKDKTEYFAVRPDGETLKDLGLNDPKNPTEVKAVSTEAATFWMNVISGWLPIILFVVLIVFMARQLGKGASSAFSFGKSQARVYAKDGKAKTTFKDVAGMEEAKSELVEVVDFLKFPKKYTKIGAKIPRGVMLIGAPGTGKTLLARAVAGEANVPFFNISGSEFVEMFVGVGASRVRDLFQKAKRNAPCIIFIDEIDAVGRQRGFGMGGGHDEREQTLNQILSEMDGFEKETNVIVMAATNRPDILDAALTRPGRFDRRVIIDMPNLVEREEILRVHARNKPLDSKTDLKKIARQTPGFSGADLENLLNEAALLAAKENSAEVTQNHIEKAVEKEGLGSERKSRKLSEEEKKITAYHETGHALVGKLLPGCPPIHKVTIIPRGMSLGSTWAVPETDTHLVSVSKFKDEICSLLGGYISERIFFNDVTTGASSDLKRATDIARRMVSEYGMSPDIGLVIFGEKGGGQFLGTEVNTYKNYSESVAAKIDDAVSKIIKEAENRTTQIISDNKELMDKIAAELLKTEVLNQEEFDAFFPASDDKKAKGEPKKK
jgi:cell division protease FtsH